MAVHIKTTEHFSKVIGTILIFLCLARKTKHLGTYSFHIKKIKVMFYSILLGSLFCSRPGSKGKVSYVDFVNLETEDEI